MDVLKSHQFGMRLYTHQNTKSDDIVTGLVIDIAQPLQYCSIHSKSFGTPDHRLMACMVSRGMDNRGFQPAYQIELYHDDGSKFVLEPGGPIRGWHLWNDDHQIAVSFKASNGQVSDTLYSLDSGDLVESLAEPADLTQLPRWAKRQEQLNDESVPMDADSQPMRILWMDKTLRHIRSHPARYSQTPISIHWRVRQIASS